MLTVGWDPVCLKEESAKEAIGVGWVGVSVLA